jgi:hypothetical protein
MKWEELRQRLALKQKNGGFEKEKKCGQGTPTIPSKEEKNTKMR